MPDSLARPGARAPLAPTPYMGWNTYYGVGGRFDERTVLEAADALVERGLARAGYRIVWLDWGWASGERDRVGDLVIDPAQWPHGLCWLTGELHARGLLAGIYTDAGPSGCEGQGVGSYGHCARDAARFAAWGFDALKIDCCGAGQARLDPEAACRELVGALRATPRGAEMLVNICNFWRPGQVGAGYPPPERSAQATHRWAAQIAQSWRTDTDIGFTGQVAFEDVLRNLDANDAHPRSAGPGRWSDPDCLAPELGLSEVEARAQLTLWAIVAAPLVIGSDVRALSARATRMLTTPEVVAIDQDPLGVQGTPVRRSRHGDAWAKPLAGDGRAVALLNRSVRTRTIRVAAADLGLVPRARYGTHEIWSGRAGALGAKLAAKLPPHGVALYRVEPAG